MHDDRRAVVIEQAERSGRQRHARRDRCHGRLAPGVRDQVRQVAHVVRVIDVRIALTTGAGIEVAAGARERRLAAADRVQVHAVRTGGEARHRHGDLHRLHAGHELHVVGAGCLGVDLAELRGARDLVAFDLGFGGHPALCRVQPRDKRRRRGHAEAQCASAHEQAPFDQGS